MSSPVHVPPIGEAREREILKDATTYAYRQTEDGPVHAHFFFPPEFTTYERHPAVVLFSGGFWDSPMRTQFVPHCHHFANRGAVAVAAETRVFQNHRTGVLQALEDAHTLLLWLKVHAAALGIDPARVTAGGAAGGAFLALTAAMLPEVANNGMIDCRPSGLVLFSPLVDTTPGGRCCDRFSDPKTAKRHSPSKLIRKQLPPSILFHGTADRILPWADAYKFARKMQRKRNVCEFVDFEGADHPFFNFNVSQNYFDLTIGAADRFLTDNGLLPAKPAE